MSSRTTPGDGSTWLISAKLVTNRLWRYFPVVPNANPAGKSNPVATVWTAPSASITTT